MIKLGSLFDGSGGFPLAGAINGIEPVWASEIEPYPIAVTKSRFPNMKHLGDVSKIKGSEIEPVDIITFGSPCFPEGTLVLTDKGLTEIERIHVGDMVLTHMGRWRKVTAVGAKEAETVILKGNHCGLECTPNHPIYARDSGGVGWVQAEDMSGRQWCVPTVAEPVPYPMVNRYKGRRYKPLPEFSDGFFYFIGRWLGDGWVRDAQRKDRPNGQLFSTVYLCDSNDKLDELKETVKCVSDRFSIERAGTCAKIKCNGRNLCDFLTENFGKYAHGKTIPAWVLTMPEQYRNALLKGILDSDGCRKERSWRVSTVSKKLAFGIRLLAESLGFATTVYFTSAPDTTEIEGRTVSQRPYYTTEILNENKHEDDGLHRWYDVKKIINTGVHRTVYNMTVEEDNSYTADGIVVHNCQDMSVAGKRAGMKHEGNGDDETTRSGLFYEAVRIIREMREATNGIYPAFAVWENVPGAFSSNKGEDFRCVLEELCKIGKGGSVSIPRPADGKWNHAGEIVGDGYSVAWRLLDAQYWGVPQRRKRIYLVADFADERAGEILFERDGVRGDSAQSRETREGTAEDAERCAGRSNHVKCLNPWDYQTIRQYAVDGVYPANTSNETGGQNRQGACYAFHLQQDPISDEIKSPCIGGQHQACIGIAAFMGGQGAKAGSVAYSEDISPTIKSVMSGGNTVPDVVYPTTARTLEARHNSSPCVDRGQNFCVYALQGNGIDRADTARCNGCGWRENECYTLNTIDRPAACFSISSFGKYTDCKPTLRASGGDCGSGSEAIYVQATESVAYFDKQRCGQYAENGVSSTLARRDYKDATNIVVTKGRKYIVRRLMPVECARLQGFPDCWGEIDEKDALTDEEAAFWETVRKTYADVMGKQYKPMKRESLLNWYNKLHTDSSEYKMWGNGIALPCAEFVVRGIAEHMRKEAAQHEPT